MASRIAVVAVLAMCGVVGVVAIGENYLGVGYNLLTGNPDGGDGTKGGVDPGLLVTRHIIHLHKNKAVHFEVRLQCTLYHTVAVK
jgi:hypothetical protein